MPALSSTNGPVSSTSRVKSPRGHADFEHVTHRHTVVDEGAAEPARLHA